MCTNFRSDFLFFLPRPSMKAYACTTRAGGELIQVIANHLTSNFGDPTLSSDVKTWNREMGLIFSTKPWQSPPIQIIGNIEYLQIWSLFSVFWNFHEKRNSCRSLSETTFTTFQWPTISIGCLRLSGTPETRFQMKWCWLKKQLLPFHNKFSDLCFSFWHFRKTSIALCKKNNWPYYLSTCQNPFQTPLNFRSLIVTWSSLSVNVLESFAHQERCRNSTPKPPGKGCA